MRRIRGLYKRGRIYWMCFQLDNGQMIRESTGKTLQSEADIVMSRRKEEIKNEGMKQNKIIEDKDYKFGELAKEYLLYVEHQKGYRSKKTFIKQLVAEFGNWELKDIDTKAVEQWQTKQLKTYKPSSVNRILACLKHMITKAVDWDKTTDETLKQVRKVKFKQENNKRLRFLDVDECQRLIDCCSKHLKPIVITAINTGMRRGEILSLKWEQIDLRHGYITLDDTKSGEGRQIPMNQILTEMFSKMPRGLESKYVFTNRDGNPFTDVKRSFSTAMKKAEIHNATFHTLRHTTGSHLAMLGIDIISIQQIMGHKSLKMCNRYLHLAPGHTKKAVNTLGNLLKSEVDNEILLHTTSHPDPLLPVISPYMVNGG